MRLIFIFGICFLALFAGIAVTQDTGTSDEANTSQSTEQEDPAANQQEQEQQQEDQEETQDPEATEPEGSEPEGSEPEETEAAEPQTQPSSTETEEAEETEDAATPDEKSTTERSTPAPSPAQGTTGTTPPPDDAPVLEAEHQGKLVASLNGSGESQSKSFQLNEGPATFNLHLNWEKRDSELDPAQAKFEVVLLDESNKEVETIIGTIDEFHGARTIDIPSAGSYMLQVKAPGNWSVKIEQ